MTDLTLTAVLTIVALLAVLLGAVTLASVLLYRGWKTNRQAITSLQAQIATQQIAALTGTQPAPTVGQPDPVRRKRHLALYLGGGLAAAIAALADRLRRLWRGHRTLTATTMATAAVVGTAAALGLVSQGTDPDDTSPPRPGATVPGLTAPSPDDEPNDDPITAAPSLQVAANTDASERIKGSAGATPPPTDNANKADSEKDDAGSKEDTSSKDDAGSKDYAISKDDADAGGMQPSPDERHEPEQPPEPTPHTTHTGHTPSPDTKQTDPEAKTEQPTEGGSDGLLCADLPRLVKLCLLGNER